MNRQRLLSVIAACALTVAGVTPAQAMSSSMTAPEASSSPQVRGSQRNQVMTQREQRDRVIELLQEADRTCDIQDLQPRGVSPRRKVLYEVRCATGLGFVLEDDRPPTFSDCLTLSGAAAYQRQRDPEAEPLECKIAENLEFTPFLQTVAQESETPCQVDAGRLVSLDENQQPLYELGCAGAMGWLVLKQADGWRRSECVELDDQTRCQFTPATEIAAIFQSKLSGVDTSGCQVGQARFVGESDTGRYYETTCNGAEGLVVRINKTGAADLVVPCSQASQLRGGCTLNTTAAPAPTGGRP